MAKVRKKKRAAKKPTKVRHPKNSPQTAGQPVPGFTPAIAPEEIVPHPTAGKKVAAFEKKLQEQIQAGEQEQAPSVQRGPGRPRKTPPEPGTAPGTGPAANLSQEIIQNGLKMPFDLWSISQGVTELKLQANEAAALAEPVKQLLDYYAPKLPTISVAWFSLAVTAYSIMAVRIRIINEVKKAKKTSDPGSGNAGPASAAPASAVQPVQPVQSAPPASIGFPTKIETEKV